MTAKLVLMVEGPDDEHVVKNICGQRQLGTIEHIRPYGGKDLLIKRIGVRLKESDIGAFGIILDADTDPHARWQAVASRLSAAGYTAVPATPAPEGTVIESPPDSLLPRVGIWLMPDNQTGSVPFGVGRPPTRWCRYSQKASCCCAAGVPGPQRGERGAVWAKGG